MLEYSQYLSILCYKTTTTTTLSSCGAISCSSTWSFQISPQLLFQQKLGLLPKSGGWSCRALSPGGLQVGLDSCTFFFNIILHSGLWDTPWPQHTAPKRSSLDIQLAELRMGVHFHGPKRNLFQGHLLLCMPRLLPNHLTQNYFWFIPFLIEPIHKISTFRHPFRISSHIYPTPFFLPV